MAYPSQFLKRDFLYSGTDMHIFGSSILFFPFWFCHFHFRCNQELNKQWYVFCLIFIFGFIEERETKANKTSKVNKTSKNKEEKPNTVEEKKNKNIILNYFQVEMMVIISILGHNFPFQSKHNSTLRRCLFRTLSNSHDQCLTESKRHLYYEVFSHRIMEINNNDTQADLLKVNSNNLRMFMDLFVVIQSILFWLSQNIYPFGKVLPCKRDIQ